MNSRTATLEQAHNPETRRRVRFERVALSPGIFFETHPDCYQIRADVRDLEEDEIATDVCNRILTITGDGYVDSRAGTDRVALFSFRYSIGLPDDAEEQDILGYLENGDIVLTIPRLRPWVQDG